MSRPKKMILQIAVLLALMGITLYLLLRDRNLSLVWASLRSARKEYIALAAASMLFYIFCGGWCIRVLLHGLGQSMSVWRCFKYSFVEFYFSALTPSSTGGQPMQLVYMKQDGYRLSDSTVLILIVTALYKLSFLVLSLVFLAAYWPLVQDKLLRLRFLCGLGLTLNILLIAALGFLLFSKKLLFRIATGTMHLLGKLRLVKNPEKRVYSLARKSIQYRRCAFFMRAHPLVVLRTFGVLTLQRLAILVVPYLVYRSFGLAQYSVGALVAVQLLLSMCVDMLPLPGAVGASETVFLILFGPIFGERLLTSAVLLSRGISFYLMVLLSGLVLCGIQLARMARKERRAKEKGGSQ